MASGDFVGAGQYEGSRIVFIGVGSRKTFDAIPLEQMDHREPREGVKAQQLLTKSGEITREFGGFPRKSLKGGAITIIFQHWLEGAQP